MPNLKEILISNVMKEEESEMVHATFYYPKAGGSQFIANRLAEGLHIRTGISVKSIEKQNDSFLINKSLEANTVIYTGDVRELSSVFVTNDKQLQAATKAHRVIYTGSFSPLNNRGSNRKTYVVEFSGKVDPEIMKREIKLLPENLTPLAYNYEPNLYVIQEADTRQKIACLKE